MRSEIKEVLRVILKLNQKTKALTFINRTDIISFYILNTV